jgi:formamidopyrimidine-DNA glycosylase
VPELPEVETVRRKLQACLPGLLVRDVTVNDVTVCDISEAALRATVVDRRVMGLRRRGKYLIVDLGRRGGGPRLRVSQREETSGERHDLGRVLVVHLRMTGQLVFKPERGSRPARFVLRFEPAGELHFADVRRFGRLWSLDPADEEAFFGAIGPEPFDASFSPDYLRRALAGRTAPLKSFLLDQRRLAGVGNIYADEALFRARLHPLRRAGSVGPREAGRLHAALRETLALGIDHAGSSVDSFIDPEGEPGSFQEILNVYQRTGEPCRVCGTPIERVTLGGRGTHYCPRCQPRRGGIAPNVRRLRAAPPKGARRPPRWQDPMG